ncbi:MAG: hypothetical protein HRT88_02180 [Lentisphaeraceae bacterium]|nr:hypothetical protein [Lentisphaeraceae bacterium]
MKKMSLLLILFFCTSAIAWQLAPRKSSIVYSHNKKFTLHLDPKTNVHTIHAVSNVEEVLWSFKKKLKHFDSYYLSNDGQCTSSSYFIILISLIPRQPASLCDNAEVASQ